MKLLKPLWVFLFVLALVLPTSSVFADTVIQERNPTSTVRTNPPGGAAHTAAATTPMSADDCKASGGVPVSSAFGVPDNCVGSHDKNPIIDMLSIVIKFATGLFGLILVLMVVYSGLRYIISGGSPDEVKEAKNHLKAAATGLVLFVLMSGLIQFILPPQFRIFG